MGKGSCMPILYPSFYGRRFKTVVNIFSNGAVQNCEKLTSECTCFMMKMPVMALQHYYSFHLNFTNKTKIFSIYFCCITGAIYCQGKRQVQSSISIADHKFTDEIIIRI